MISCAPECSETATTTARRAARTWAADAALAIVGLGLGITVGLGVTAVTASSLAAPGGIATALGQLAGLVGSYLMLVMVLLVARLPLLEQVIGQDRLVRWHRVIGGWPILLIAMHAVLVTVGYAQQSQVGPWHEFRVLLSSYPDVLAAVVAFGLLVLAGVTSYRAARSKLRYETWWVAHLYLYLALALAFSHQLADGVSFVGHPLARAFWIAIWASTAGVVLVFRVGLPVWRSLYHRLRVVTVREEAPGVVSVICAGSHLERLPISGGQFLQWRFLTDDLWWQAHPYSISALPQPPYVRVTIKALGDFSRTAARLPPGTRVAIEGPYGAVTKHVRATDKVILIAAGVGVTPLRALLEDFPARVDVEVVLRASVPEDVLFHHEIAPIVASRAGRLHVLVGDRRSTRLGSRALRRLVPDVADRDVYVCGPDGFTDQVVKTCLALGVPRRRIHHESFAF